MLVMCTIRRRRFGETLALLVLGLSASIPADAVAEGRLTPGLKNLIEQRRADRDLVGWQADLAKHCAATIRSGGSGDRIVFEARPVTELLVHYDSGFDQLAGVWAGRVAFRNDRLNYLVVRIPPATALPFFERDVRNLLRTPGVRLIEPRCLPARSGASAEDDEPCVSPDKLAHALDRPGQVRDAADCDRRDLDKNREAIGLPLLLDGPAGKTTLVAVIDVGFDQFDSLGSALGEARYDQGGSLIMGVNGWDYCENDAGIDGERHGTQMSGLVGASCTDFNDAPGVSQSGLIVGMQVFYDSGGGTLGFAGPEALAAAIHDAQSMGARVVNMSFTIHPESGDGWTPVRNAMEQAEDVVFVTGPWEAGELPFPARLRSDNMILVGARKWNRDGDLSAHTWGSSLHIDAPWAGKLVISPELSGASNAIAYVTGAVADLLGRPGCASLRPAEAREILVQNGAPASDSDTRPLLQVGFLSNPGCH